MSPRHQGLVRPLLLPLAALAALVAQAACDPTLPEVASPRTLAPYPNPFGPTDPQWAPQPPRHRPTAVVPLPDRPLALVSLTGTEDEPGHEVLLVDLERRAIAARFPVGAGPSAIALHPDGDLAVVNARLSNYLTVVHLGDREVIHHPEVPFYVSALAFSPDGDELWLANRWRDDLSVRRVERRGRGLALGPVEVSLPMPTNPRELAVSPDGAWLAVGGPTSLELALVDRIGRRVAHLVDLGAPVSGFAFAGPWLVVATQSRSTHHLPLAGPDTDGDGQPGDGTPNTNFQDLQNELAVIDTRTGKEAWRYTSDTICCLDFRDVSPDDAARHGELLPDRSTWIVGGALPEQVTVSPRGDGFEVWVGYAASNQLQRFTLDPRDGSLSPGPVVDTPGHVPFGLAATERYVLSTLRLSDALALFTHDAEPVATVDLGPRGAPPYPATDAEIGELFNHVTAPFSVDGDQSCVHCHRDNGNIAKALSMPLTLTPGVGLRQVMAYRGAADTRPWFFEAAMDQHNFKPVTNEFARVENFCCSDYTLFPEGAPADCERNPPAVCATASSPGTANGFDASRAEAALAHAPARPTAYPSRDTFYLAVARRVVGRDTSFGDGLYFEDLETGARSPIALRFDAMTRALGLFLLTAPRLLPNPNAPDDAAALRGKALFESPETGCSSCHPAPTFAVSTTHNPANRPLAFAAVVTPYRAPDGKNLDLLSPGFSQTFPAARSETCKDLCDEATCAEDPTACDDARSVYFGAPSLRGIWDRAPRFLHDGRAHSLREVLCTPGHPALAPGERGYNERDGIPDTHGGTSHLDARDIADLIHYLETL